MAECILCGVSLSGENDSEEHIVINAIGGRYKVAGVLCVSCNKGAGEKWDSALASDLQSLGLLVGVKRDRGALPSLPVKNLEGEQLLLHADGSMSPAKVTFSERQDESGGVKIELVARSAEELRKILKGVKRKHPNFDLDLALSEAEEKFIYSSSPINLSLDFGGPLSGRSLVKSALCFAVVNGISSRDCDSAKKYLLDHNEEACFGYWYDQDIVLNRPEGVPIHCVAVSNLDADGQLLAYVEFFGVRRMVVCLSENYVGPPVHAMHCIDPRTSEKMVLEFDLGLSANDVKAAYEYRKIPDGSIELAFSSILREALRRSSVRERERAVDRAVQYAFKNHGAKDGEVLTDEGLSRLSDLLVQGLMPYLEHALVKPKTP
ncbi:HNH endonuclease [Pseudomonas sp. EMN2]|uniref:HNH endonuclease n=1 Tax=Pseudomonas sp. EMN2 TaxID=2615212 RepID=UPI00129A7E9F|nr:HNH endonuclease [Pseudomonas sp. EMN2]